MSRFWKVFVVLALVLPVGGFVVGSLVTASQELPTRDTIIVEPTSSTPSTRLTPSPPAGAPSRTPSPPTTPPAEENPDDTGGREDDVVTPRVTDADRDDRDDD